MIDDLRTAEYVTRTLGGVRGALRQLLAEPSTRLAAAFYFPAVGKNILAVEKNYFAVKSFIVAVEKNLTAVRIYLIAVRSF